MPTRACSSSQQPTAPAATTGMEDRGRPLACPPNPPPNPPANPSRPPSRDAPLTAAEPGAESAAWHPVHMYPGHMYPGHMDPGHMYPGHMYPGHMYPGHMDPVHMYPAPAPCCTTLHHVVGLGLTVPCTLCLLCSFSSSVPHPLSPRLSISRHLDLPPSMPPAMTATCASNGDGLQPPWAYVHADMHMRMHTCAHAYMHTYGDLSPWGDGRQLA